MNAEKSIREMIEVGNQLYQKDLLVGTDGNFSVRLGEKEIVITASGFCKGKLQESSFAVVSPDGQILSGPKPARDIRMHLAVYRQRPDITAVVHAHPPVATGLSMTGGIEQELLRVALPEVLFNLHGIAVTEYCTPISCEVPEELAKAMKKTPQADAVLLANHGALTMGDSIWEAFYKMETLEMFCKALLVSKLFGTTSYLSEGQVQKVNRIIQGEDPDTVACS